MKTLTNATPTTEATELYHDENGKYAAITYCAGPRGHTVSLHGVEQQFRVRFIDIETARMIWGVLRLKLKLMGYERRKPELRVA